MTQTNHGAVTLDGIKIKLTQAPYHNDMPEFGHENEYNAYGKDKAGNEYLVVWYALPDWDEEDESLACDWIKPVRITKLS